MVGTICPIGDGTRSKIQRAIDAWLFAACCLVGGGLAGLLLGAFGEIAFSQFEISRSSRLVIVAAVALLALLADYAMPSRSFFGVPRQVPAIWFSTRSRPYTVSAWGLQLGCGFLTYNNWAGMAVLLAAGIAVGLPWAMFPLSLFGLIRGLQPLTALAVMKSDDAEPGFVSDFMDRVPEIKDIQRAVLGGVTLILLLLFL